LCHLVVTQLKSAGPTPSRVDDAQTLTSMPVTH